MQFNKFAKKGVIFLNIEGIWYKIFGLHPLGRQALWKVEYTSKKKWNNLHICLRWSEN